MLKFVCMNPAYHRRNGGITIMDNNSLNDVISLQFGFFFLVAFLVGLVLALLAYLARRAELLEKNPKLSIVFVVFGTAAGGFLLGSFTGNWVEVVYLALIFAGMALPVLGETVIAIANEKRREGQK